MLLYITQGPKQARQTFPNAHHKKMFTVCGKAKLWCHTSATWPPMRLSQLLVNTANVLAPGCRLSRLPLWKSANFLFSPPSYCKCLQQSAPEGSGTLFPSSLLVQRHSWWDAHSAEQPGWPCLPSAAASPGNGNYSSCLSRSTAGCTHASTRVRLAGTGSA